MDECFLQPYSQEKLLHRLLGPWTVDPTLTCAWVYSLSHGLLFQRETVAAGQARPQPPAFVKWQSRTPGRAATTVQQFHNTGIKQPPPEDAAPASVQRVDDHTVSLTGHCSLAPFQPPLSVVGGDTLEDHWRQLTSMDQWAVSELKSEDEGASLAQMLQAGIAIAVSDSSHCPGHSTSAFILT